MTVPLSRTAAVAATTAAVTLAATALGLAQRPRPAEVQVSGGPYRPAPSVIVSQSNLVELGVVVRSRSGEPLAGLGRDRFRVSDNGAPRPLTSFTMETAAATPPAAGPPRLAGGAAAAAAPRSVALFFDDVTTDKRDLTNARIAAARFIREDMGAADRAAVFTASSESDFGFTGDKARLAAAIAAIRSHPRSAVSLQPCPRITAYEAQLIVEEHDPTAEAAVEAEARSCNGASSTSRGIIPDAGRSMSDMGNEEMLAQAEATFEQSRAIAQDVLAALGDAVAALHAQPGQRIMLLASGGFVSGSLGAELDNIVHSALRAQVVINALDATGLYSEGPGRPPGELSATAGPLPLPTFLFEESTKPSKQLAEESAMLNLAQSTGGLFFHDNNDLTMGFERLGLAPGVSYELAFVPQGVVADGELHRLRVRLQPPIPGATIQARPGYFAPAPPTPGAGLQRRLDTALRATASEGGVPAALRTRAWGNQIRVAVRLDVARMPFQDDHGRRTQKLVVLAGLYNLQGAFVAGRRGEMDLALKPATWKRLCAQGLSANLSLSAPPGTYRLRVVAGLGSDGSISAFSESVRLPTAPR